MADYTPTRPPRSSYKWMKPGERYGEVVLIERVSTRRWLCACDCGNKFIAVGSHLRAGKTTTCGHWRAEPDPDSYNAVHIRLGKARGKASSKQCVDCGSPATEWAYNRSGVAEKSTIRNGYPVVYSTDIAQYDPCCGPCHYGRDHHD